MVGNRRHATAQQTPRIAVQVSAPNTLPTRRIAPLGGTLALLLGLAAVSLTAATSGQLGAPGDGARGAGLTRHYSPISCREVTECTDAPEVNWCIRVGYPIPY